jgi:O-antigen/teichoic acid export membrane protein
VASTRHESGPPVEPGEIVVEPAHGADILDTSEAGPAAIRGGALRAGGYAAGILLSLISAPLLIRHLGVTGYGQFVTVSSLLFILLGLTDGGLTNVGVREYATLHGAARERFMRSFLALRGLLPLAGGVLAVAFAVAVGYDSTLVAGTAIGAASVVLVIVGGTFTVPLIARLRLGWVSVLELLRQAVTVAGIVALVIAGAGLLPFFVVPVVAAVPALIVGVFLVRGQMPLRPAFDLREWGPILRATLPFAAATALGFVYFRVTVIAMSLLSTAEQTGYFSASFRIVEVLIAVPSLLVTAAFPILARAARDDAARLRYALQRLFEVAVICGVGVALLLVVVAPFAIDVIAGSKFRPSVEVLRIQGLALMGTFLVATWGFALLSLRQHRALILTNVAAMAIAAIATAVLAPSLGARGGAIATTITEWVLPLLYLVAILRVRPDLRPRLAVVPKALAAAGVAAAVALVPGLPSLPGTLIAAVIYVGLLFVLRAVPGEVIDAIPRPGRARPV